MTDHLTSIEVENTAQTMRSVMEEISNHDAVATPDGADLTKPVLVSLPNKRTISNLTDAHISAQEFLKPTRRRGTARLDDLKSLIAWANRFKSEETVLFAKPDMSAPTLQCIADYHCEGPLTLDTETGDPKARHLKHRALYSFPLSEDWTAWNAISGVPLEKDDLGEFIEAQAKDIMDPTPAIIKGVENTANADWENRMIQTAAKIEGRFGQLTKLLAMSKQFQVFESSDLAIKTNRDTGESEIQFLNEHKDADGKPLKIPNLIIIAIPVFMGGAPYRMAVRFRYRKMAGQVKFILSIYNPEKAFEAAFNEAVEKATEETKLPTFMGSPEA